MKANASARTDNDLLDDVDAEGNSVADARAKKALANSSPSSSPSPDPGTSPSLSPLALAPTLAVALAQTPTQP
jgi:hypothetical protein